MDKNKITIDEEGKDQRLDKFLTDRLADLSRAKIQKMIGDAMILVNGKKVLPHRFLKINDEIEIQNLKLKNQNSKLEIRNLKLEIPGGAEASKLLQSIKIIKNNDDFLIINKPPGLLVHPTEKNETGTLVDWLMEKYPELSKIGESPERPAIVHRLDKEVSGLMIIPKSQGAFDYFKEQFREHKIVKKYLALVYGEVEADEAEINFPIGRSKVKDGLFAAHPLAKNEKFGGRDKKAITDFSVIQRFKNYTLLEVAIFTGRTHQIRVHLLAYGHPVVGDKLYFHGQQKKAAIGRIFLHAARLAFTGPDKKKYEFESPLPEELSNFIKN